MANPVKFFREVREETAKVTWPTQKETIITTVMVLIMSVISAIFFLLADQVLSKIVKLVLSL